MQEVVTDGPRVVSRLDRSVCCVTLGRRFHLPEPQLGLCKVGADNTPSLQGCHLFRMAGDLQGGMVHGTPCRDGEAVFFSRVAMTTPPPGRLPHSRNTLLTSGGWRSRGRPTWCLAGSSSWFLDSCHVLLCPHWVEGTGSTLGLFSKGTNLLPEGFTLMTYSPPQGSPPDAITGEGAVFHL